MDLAPVVVDNPVEYAERVINPTITAVRTLRDDPLGQMHHRRQISEAQYRAGRQWQADYEAAGAKLKSSGDLQEPVGGSRPMRDGVTDRQMQARMRLERYEELMEPRHAELMHMVLAEKLKLWACTARLFPDEINHHRYRFVGMWFRDGLSLLAKAMGLG